MLKRRLFLRSQVPRVFLIKIILLIAQLLSAKGLLQTKVVKDSAVLKKTGEILIYQDIQET